MIQKEMTDKLNKQLNIELFSSNLYLQISAWCKGKGLNGVSQFFKTHSNEEMNHMRRFFDYLSDSGSMPELEAVAKPLILASSLTELVKFSYEHEKMISEKINRLVHMAISLQDYSTFHFLQWFVSEQHEEEKVFKSILDKISLVNIEANGLFFIDRDLKNVTK
ncbi:non-heme ferritin [Sodalis sp. CWE]|uniref:non-heme ferritin n=1 Tax=Sodalis sp. CWE TaxID=2803816 RepID=UPI001C7D7C5B|nr:non-heme ferritin [Sodalis sp. CWE]MBX4181187.1 non-heme ferritin [Sodalis sp. CWE]